MLFALGMAACGDTEGKKSAGGGTTVVSTPVPYGVEATLSAVDATATFGAEQFYLQLTAMADGGQ